MTEQRIMKCPKCGGQSFIGCRKCTREEMWQCEGCGFVAHRDYLEGKPLPSELSGKFECPQCGKGVEVIGKCVTCRGEEWRCENCGFTGSLQSFKPVPKEEKRSPCCGGR